jgi:biopolymer transport protein ExbB
MLGIGVEHLHETKELIEEVMFERLLDTRFRLNRALPFIAVGAACAPLLGLLGTVTGIISTFKLLTVFGSGDIKMLSAGISEALITTECGLYVAIPSLLSHAFLSRKAKSVTDKMERQAIAFMAGVTKFRSGEAV